MRPETVTALLVFTAAVLARCASSDPPAGGAGSTDAPGAATGDSADEVRITMQPCESRRPRSGAEGLLTGRRLDDNVKLARRGLISVGGEEFAIYLPKRKPYSIVNTGRDDTAFSNTSTLLAVDHDRDGKLGNDENRYANLPLRIADRMFDVREIAADGGSILLAPSESPLSSIIVGRACPPISYATLDGRTITLEDFRGKAVLLDVWSVT